MGQRVIEPELFQTDTGGEFTFAGRRWPVASKIDPTGSLQQQGISGEGFQREIGVDRHTEIVGGKTKFCWDLHLYQHPGCRKTIPLGCTATSKKTGAVPAPAEARRLARALHKLAKAGYDPSDPPPGGQGGIPRGQLWHQFAGNALCGSGDLDLAGIRKYLKRQGLW